MKVSCTEFCENPTNSRVADTTLQVGGRKVTFGTQGFLLRKNLYVFEFDREHCGF
jgi:hypothetical protein